jgi:alpha-L-fucosidase
MNGGRDFPSDVQDETYRDFYGPAHPGKSEKGKNPPSEPFMDDWLMRCAELVDNYRPQLFWFDWWIEQPEMASYLRRFASYYYNRGYAWGHGVAINYKNEAFPENAAVLDVERGQLASTREKFWQTDTAVAKNSWSYVNGMDYKTTESLVHDLVDIVSKNGALLLNIGPKADGTIPTEDQAILREIGAWLKRNGEAIYGTRPWKVYGEGPTKVIEGPFADTKRESFTAEDIRFTQKNGAVYAIILSGKVESVNIASLGSDLVFEPRTIENVEILGGGNCPFQREKNGLVVKMPKSDGQKHALTLKITFA